jgi:hypothetical protein
MTETEAKWAERVGQWKSSGRSADDYAKGQGFEGSTLRLWSSRLGRRGVTGQAVAESTGTQHVRMVRVVAKVKATGGPLAVRVGVAGIEVRPDAAA